MEKYQCERIEHTAHTGDDRNVRKLLLFRPRSWISLLIFGELDKLEYLSEAKLWEDNIYLSFLLPSMFLVM